MFKKCAGCITMLVLSICLSGVLQAQNDVQTETRRITAPPSVDRPYDILHIRDGGSRVVNPETGKTVFRKGPDRRYHWELIEMALYHAHVTVIPSGTVKIQKSIEIPTSYTTFIIGPDAELVVQKDDDTGSTIPGTGAVIKNVRRNNVNIFNLGTLDAGGNGFGIKFDGRSGGKLGIRGGMIFGTGALKNTYTGHWLIDSSNVHVPLMWARSWGNGLLIPEGTEDLEVGFVAGLLPNDTEYEGEAEVMDVQPRNKRVRINQIVGTLVGGQDEILDINNSPNTRVVKATAYGNVDVDKQELIGGSKQFIDVHKYGQRKNRRTTQKVWINKNSPGTELGETSLVKKDVKKWKTTVNTPGFPDNLPIFKINVRLTAVFADGSTERVFARNFHFDLINRTNR